MRKRVLLVFFIISLGFIAKGYASEGDDILGEWLTANNKSKVVIYKCGSRYCGKIIWLKEPIYKSSDPESGKAKRDRNNPNPARQNDSIIGLKLLWSFNYEDGAWENGRIYDPENGKTYKCIIKMQGNQLKVRGYIGFSLIGRTTLWQRVK
jgi:uncharacterized protein (DUF2147 family)